METRLRGNDQPPTQAPTRVLAPPPQTGKSILPSMIGVTTLATKDAEIKVMAERLEAKKKLYSAGRINARELYEAINEHQNLLIKHNQAYAKVQKDFGKLQELLPVE